MLALALEYCTHKSSREEAAKEVEAAIECFEHRLSTKAAEKEDDERQMLDELKIKLAELKAPAEQVKREDIADIFGKEGNALKESLVQAMQTSNDLTGLVRKRNKTSEPSNKKAKLDE